MSSWLPVFSRPGEFYLGEQKRYTKEPFPEQTLTVVAGSERINVNLPDPLFTVTRKSAYSLPKELKEIESQVRLGSLARKFQGQAPSPA